MKHQRYLLLLSAFALGGLSGCGGKTEAPESTTVITPATSQEETPAAKQEEAPAASQEEAPSETAVAQAESTEPAAAETPGAVAQAQPAGEAAEETVVAAHKPASVALGAEPGGTTFKGRVTVRGSISDPPPITPSKDPFCIALGRVPDETLVVGEDEGLANVFVWLRKFPSGVDVPAVPDEPVALDNVKCIFQPHAFVMRVGQPMFIKNDDSTGHNTHTSPLRNIGFNQLIPANDRKGVEVVYQREEILPINTKCDIHPWMVSYHFPLDHPWAAVTDENGNFEITGLPAGDLDFRLWHERMGYVERSVKIKFEEGQVVEQSFEVDAAKLKQ